MKDRELHSDPPGTGTEDTAVRLLRLAGRRPEIDPRRADRVRKAVEQRWRDRVQPEAEVVGFPIRKALMAIAAVLVVGVTTVVWRNDFLRGPSGGLPVATAALVEGAVWQQASGADERTPVLMGGEITAGSELSTGSSGRLALRLADGHSLRLDRQSRVTLASNTDLELTQGALYVDSNDHHQAQVAIQTRLGAVREIGTQFEVRLMDAGLQVRVREGRVEVLGGDERHEVLAGRRLIRYHDGHVNVDDIRPFGESWGWVGEIAPPFALEGRRLDEFLGWVSREAGLEIRFEPEELSRTAGGIRLHGELPSVRPESTPDIVLPTCGLTAAIEDGVMTVTREGSGD